MADDGEFEFDDLNSIFQAATDYVRQNNAKFETEKLLYFYARFKQAKDGKCNTPKPSFFDFQGKAKWDAWHKLGDMTKTQAMMEYVSLLTNIEQEWRSKMPSTATSGDNSGSSNTSPSSGGRKQGLGVSVSIMSRTESDLQEGEKTVFDWCKEGNVDKVREILSASGGLDVNGLDSEGLSLMHWASDRGMNPMVEMLLSLQADINIQDVDSQTALHYAVSCEHPEMIRLLTARGIDQSVQDSEGNTAMDIASDDMKILIKELASASIQGDNDNV